MKKIQVRHEDLFNSMANMIAQAKRVTLAVSGTKKEPSFFYTIGNQEKQLPELLVIGNFKPDIMCTLLNALSDKMLAGETMLDGGLISVGGEYPVLIYKAVKDVKEKYTIQAGQFYGNEDYEVMQVVLPDKKGIYPPDPKCHKDFQVPVLRESKDGQREPTRGTAND